MEIKLTFSNPSQNERIPIDYQYLLSSWMYRIISEGDSDYGNFLHEVGYRVTNSNENDTIIAEPKKQVGKVFKLFNFSNLLFPKFRIEPQSDTIQILSSTFELKVRFMVDAALESFVKGLFTGQSLTIKNGFNSMVTFEICAIESCQIEVKYDLVHLRALSPIVVSKTRSDGSEEYLNPEHQDYEKLFFHNLLSKFLAAGGKLKPEWKDAKQRFAVTTSKKIQSKLITIRKGNERPIKVKGYLFNFELEASSELIETGLLAGFGKDNAMGFGFGSIVTTTKGL